MLYSLLPSSIRQDRCKRSHGLTPQRAQYTGTVLTLYPAANRPTILLIKTLYIALPIEKVVQWDLLIYVIGMFWFGFGRG